MLYKQVKVEQPELYDLYTDISESKNLAVQNPDVAAKHQQHVEAIRAELGDSLMKMNKGTGTREAGKQFCKSQQSRLMPSNLPCFPWQNLIHHGPMTFA